MKKRPTQTSFAIDDDLLDRAKFRALKEKISLAKLFRTAIKEYLAKPFRAKVGK